MNSLQQAVAARRAAETGVGPMSHAPNSAARTLRIESGGCECWLLAWTQFVSAHYEQAAGGERLILRFSEYEVAVLGHRLARLVSEVAALRLECLRAELRPEAAAAKGSDPVVTRVEVRALSRPERSGENPKSYQ